MSLLTTFSPRGQLLRISSSSSASSSVPAALAKAHGAAHTVIGYTSLVDEVKRICQQMDPPLPLMQEYDFRHDAYGVPPLLESQIEQHASAALSIARRTRPVETRSATSMDTSAPPRTAKRKSPAVRPGLSLRSVKICDQA